MAARSAWKGAVEFAGFPVQIALYPRVKSRAAESFKTLAPDGQPVRSIYIDSQGNKVERDDQRKGVKVGKDQFQPLTPEALDAIGSMQKSDIVAPLSFAPVESVPLELAVSSYQVAADSSVAGAEKSTSILWNGLRSTGLAYVTDVTMTSGSRDAILVLYARDDGLYACTLPFRAELHEPIANEFEEDPKAAALFEQFVGDQAEEFDHSAFTSEYRTRREAAIEAVLAGKTPEPTPAPAAKADDADLLAALEDAVKSKPKAKKATKKQKVAA